MKYCTNVTSTLIKNTTINAKYSDLKIRNAGKLNLVSAYIHVAKLNCDSLIYNSQYGKIKVHKINTLDATSTYLTIGLEALFEMLKLSSKYSSLKIDAIQASVHKICIISCYTEIIIKYETNFNFNFNILLKFANLKHNTNMDF